MKYTNLEVVYKLQHANQRGNKTYKKKSCDPISANGLEKLIKKFEDTSSFEVKSGRWRKPVASTAIEDMTTGSQQKTGSSMGSCIAREIAQLLHIFANTVHKILRKILHFYRFKITLAQELHSADLLAWQTFAVEFLASMEVDNEWPWNNLWIDEAHFNLQRYVNTQNFRIWGIWLTEIQS